ncbi:MAG: phosphoribulokinase [Sulfobacillus acidophilus]|uniref:phosphoribulokinase n=1 Tax=Sulfobacillus acidophilus TaxID=53633 RepID=A0A2T2WIV7_9FIRM|nr:MAG: phosphoribulokinase [Sulfobacillus acidophilus]
MMTERQSVMVGICGDSGAGKSTYAEALRQLLGPERVSVIALDDYHSLDRKERERVGVTALHPYKANNLGLLVDHVWSLRRGEAIVKPVYDHRTGTFASPVVVQPHDIVILEGLHVLYLERLRSALDLRLYFDTDADLRAQWKIRRDAGVRGYTPAAVLAEIERRRPDVERYIEPQKGFADVVIHYTRDHETPPTDENPEPIRVRFAERLTGSKRRLVKWLALAGSLGLVQSTHFRDEITGHEMEIASLTGTTKVDALDSLIEMVSDRHLLSEYVARNLTAIQYDPVSVSRILIASMISLLEIHADGAPLLAGHRPHG